MRSSLPLLRPTAARVLRHPSCCSSTSARSTYLCVSPSVSPSALVRPLSGAAVTPRLPSPHSCPLPCRPPSSDSARSARPVLEASSFTLALLSASLALGGAIYYRVFHQSSPADSDDEQNLSYSLLFDHTTGSPKMAIEIPPGRPGNLSPEQQEKLRIFWVNLFRICNVDYADAEATHAAAQEGAVAEPASPVDDKKKKRGGFFKRSKDEGAAPAKTNSAEADHDKYGQGKIFQEALSSMGPELILKTLWDMVKYDHPDALALRFLRARKWDVDKAIVMMVSTLHWRAIDMKVDSDIMKNGEEAALEAGKSSDPETKKNADDFLQMMRTGKCFLHGHDALHRPICVVRVRQHKIGEQSEASLERGTVYTIETCRMLLKPPVDTAHIIFDLTNFSLSNMDYAPVKFIIKCFEANYPECLGVVCVHRAPWIFQGIWKIIKGWLDPVVAAKVQFTNNLKDLEEYIPRANILKELDGPEDFEYKFVEPVPGENDLMKDTDTRDKLRDELHAIADEFTAATCEWIACPPESDRKSAILTKRDEIAARLRAQYWKLDPYIRARGVYDRTGIIKPGGFVDYYPKPETNGNGNGYTNGNGNGVANGHANGAAQ